MTTVMVSFLCRQKARGAPFAPIHRYLGLPSYQLFQKFHLLRHTLSVRFQRRVRTQQIAKFRQRPEFYISLLTSKKMFLLTLQCLRRNFESLFSNFRVETFALDA